MALYCADTKKTTSLPGTYKNLLPDQSQAWQKSIFRGRCNYLLLRQPTHRATCQESKKCCNEINSEQNDVTNWVNKQALETTLIPIKPRWIQPDFIAELAKSMSPIVNYCADATPIDTQDLSAYKNGPPSGGPNRDQAGITWPDAFSARYQLAALANARPAPWPVDSAGRSRGSCRCSG